jgi:hypothetical protein
MRGEGFGSARALRARAHHHRHTGLHQASHGLHAFLVARERPFPHRAAVHDRAHAGRDQAPCLAHQHVHVGPALGVAGRHRGWQAATEDRRVHTPTLLGLGRDLSDRDRSTMALAGPHRAARNRTASVERYTRRCAGHSRRNARTTRRRVLVTRAGGGGRRGRAPWRAVTRRAALEPARPVGGRGAVGRDRARSRPGMTRSVLVRPVHGVTPGVPRLKAAAHVVYGYTHRRMIAPSEVAR